MSVSKAQETIDLNSGEAEAFEARETVRITVSQEIAKKGVFLLEGGASQLVESLVSMPTLPDCPVYDPDVAPPVPICGICKGIGSNNLVLVWHVGNCIPAVRIKHFQIWMCKEPYEEWLVVGDVSALTPPMSCILTKLPYGISHFTVRAIDVEGRQGPFAVPATCKRRFSN